MNPEYSLEGLMLKLKVQYFDHLMQTDNSLEKTLMLERLRPQPVMLKKLKLNGSMKTYKTF